MRPPRGIYEHSIGSGIWRIECYDTDGRRRRETIGDRKTAIEVRQRRIASIREARAIIGEPNSSKSGSRDERVRTAPILAGTWLEGAYFRDRVTGERVGEFSKMIDSLLSWMPEDCELVIPAEQTATQTATRPEEENRKDIKSLFFKSGP